MAPLLLLFAALASLVFAPGTVRAGCPSPGGQVGPTDSPLVLDLNGDGIYTTSVYNPVEFDLDGDGLRQLTTWINPQTGDAFLVLDLNGNGIIDSGRELFGNATLLPDGSTAAHGFEALAVYDEPAFGGNGDGTISPRDRIWSRLRLWSDTVYDGHSEPWELSRLRPAGVWTIGLDYVEENRRDGSLNLHWLKGSYVKKIGGSGPPGSPPPIFRAYVVEDIGFYYAEPDF